MKIWFLVDLKGVELGTLGLKYSYSRLRIVIQVWNGYYVLRMDVNASCEHVHVSLDIYMSPLDIFMASWNIYMLSRAHIHYLCLSLSLFLPLIYKVSLSLRHHSIQEK